ncbi:MAG: transcriptional repressor LexA [Acidobacteriota bacterium]
MKTLTRRQREIYDFLRNFITREGYSPTVFDIAEHFQLRATSTVSEHLQALEEAGMIIRGKKGALVQLPQYQEIPRMVAIPFYGQIAAGAPLEVVNQSAEMVYVPTELVRGDCYALRAHGDSMIEDGILDGDLLIIRHCRQAEQGQTVVALMDGVAATVKKFYQRGKQVILEPANQRLRPLTLAATRVEIQGVVQAVIRHY